MDKNSKIYVAGAAGLVGSAVVRKLQADGYASLITDRVDLTKWQATMELFARHEPDYVFLCAAKVGGILANRDSPADFIRDNLLIQTNVIRLSEKYAVKKLVFLGSSCIYPKMCPQPIKEEYLMSGPLEPTNSAYAVAKIAGIEMVKAYRKQYGLKGISLMPTNLYGQGDNFDLTSSHVLPAMIRKFHEAKVGGHANVTLWGDGSPKREFLHCDDLADAIVFLMNTYDSEEIINVGCGQDISIHDLAKVVKEVVGYKGEIIWDTAKPNGTPRKVLDVSKLVSLGWQPKIALNDGLAATYDWFLEKKCQTVR